MFIDRKEIFLCPFFLDIWTTSYKILVERNETIPKLLQKNFFCYKFELAVQHIAVSAFFSNSGKGLERKWEECEKLKEAVKVSVRICWRWIQKLMNYGPKKIRCFINSTRCQLGECSKIRTRYWLVQFSSLSLIKFPRFAKFWSFL